MQKASKLGKIFAKGNMSLMAIFFAIVLVTSGCGGGGGTLSSNTTTDTGVNTGRVADGTAVAQTDGNIAETNAVGTNNALAAARMSARAAGKQEVSVAEYDKIECRVHWTGQDQADRADKGWSAWTDDCSDYSGKNFRHIYPGPGKYPIKVQFRGKGCTASTCQITEKELEVDVPEDELAPANTAPTKPTINCDKSRPKVGEKVRCTVDGSTDAEQGTALLYSFEPGEGTVFVATDTNTFDYVYSSENSDGYLLAAFTSDGKNISEVATTSLVVDPAPATAPSAASVTVAIPEMVYASTFTLEGTKDAGTAVWINGYEVVPANSSATWTYTVALVEYSSSFVITTKNDAGLYSEPIYITVLRDIKPALLPIILNPTDPVNSDTYVVTGWRTKDEKVEWIDDRDNVLGIVANADTDYTEETREERVQWSHTVQIQPGSNYFRYLATNKAGKTARNSLSIDKGSGSGTSYDEFSPAVGTKASVSGLTRYASPYSSGFIVLTKRTNGDAYDIYAEFYSSSLVKGWEQKLDGVTSPAGIKACGNNLFISQGNTILTFAISGSTITTSTPIIDSHLAKPMGMDCSSDSASLFVANNGTGSILKFKISDGSFLKEFTANALKGISSLAVDFEDRRIYAITSGNKTVCLDIMDESISSSINWLNSASGIAYYRPGLINYLMIADQSSYKIEIISAPSFERITKIGKKGDKTGEFGSIVGVVANASTKTVLIIDSVQGAVTTLTI